MSQRIIDPTPDQEMINAMIGSAESFSSRHSNGTPFYFYDGDAITERCHETLQMPNPFGLTVRYAMKANSSRGILQLISEAGIKIDASSFYEVQRAMMAGIPAEDIMLTTQSFPEVSQQIFGRLIEKGLSYNVCSLRQYKWAQERGIKTNLSIRIHPGVGSGESETRNTGGEKACFGVHRDDDLEGLLSQAHKRGVHFDGVHVHIGSGGDPKKWADNIDRILRIVEEHFEHLRYATRLNLGGGFRVARMPDETPADIQALGEYASQQLLSYEDRTGQRFHMEVEPGTYIIANAGYIVTKVIDTKGTQGFSFVLCSGGMEVNLRPTLYGSRHPFYIASPDGKIKFSDWDIGSYEGKLEPRVIVGRCCESGDSQTLGDDGKIEPRMMVPPMAGDYLIIGGAGAYGASMSPFNYNSYPQAPEVMQLKGITQVIRNPQRLEQITANERGLGEAETI